MKKILVINGPNLNMLGKRDNQIYGSLTLDEINELMKREDYFSYEFFQSNHEGAIVDKIQESLDIDGLVINAAAYSHTSIAIRDALEVLKCPKVEVHLSDITKREEFRKFSYITGVCDKTIMGLKEKSYIEAIRYLHKIINML